MSSTSNSSNGLEPQKQPKRDPSFNERAEVTEAARQEAELRAAVDSVSIGSSNLVSMSQRTPPVADLTMLHGGLPSEAHPRVIMSQQALEQVNAHSESDMRVELGGVLLGHAYQHNEQMWVEVEVAVPARTIDNGPVHFTFTADAWSAIHADCAKYPDLSIVGWFHTHPDLGVFFSADDEVVQQAAFTQPWHVGLVVDPVRRHASFFGWDKQTITPIEGFYELIPPDAAPADEMPHTVIDWQVKVDNSWFSSPMLYRQQSLSQDGDVQALGLPAINPWLAVMLSGAAVVISSTALALSLYLYLNQ